MKRAILALALVGFTYGAFANVQVPAKTKTATHTAKSDTTTKKKHVKKVKAAEKPAEKK